MQVPTRKTRQNFAQASAHSTNYSLYGALVMQGSSVDLPPSARLYVTTEISVSQNLRVKAVQFLTEHQTMATVLSTRIGSSRFLLFARYRMFFIRSFSPFTHSSYHFSVNVSLFFFQSLKLFVILLFNLFDFLLTLKFLFGQLLEV